MVNKYKRKTDQAPWSESTMKLAMDEAKKTSVSAAARKYGITLSTLQRHFKKGSSKIKLGRYKTVFNEVQENELLEHIFKVDGLFYGLTKIEVLELVFQYAEENNIAHPFKHGRAGNDWYCGFKNRHPELTIRQPEPTSLAQSRGIHKAQVKRFYDLMEGEIEKYDIDATRIYYVDEIGILTSSNKPPIVLTRTGKKQVGELISSVDGGQLTTVVCCCNAAGSFIPPFLIFGRKAMVCRLLDGAPPGACATYTDNGCMHGPTFLEWLRHFADVIRPSSERKVVLVMDHQESHKCLRALEYAFQNNVILVSLPPHSTHRMQPLDRVYGSLKTYFEQAVLVLQRSYVGQIISQYEVARLFSEAYMRAASEQNAIYGFKSTGIWPTNRHIFVNSDRFKSTVIESPDPLPSLSAVVEDVIVQSN